MNDIVVIGAGPAGMMAAIVAAKAGHQVTLLEKNEKIDLRNMARKFAKEVALEEGAKEAFGQLENEHVQESHSLSK